MTQRRIITVCCCFVCPNYDPDGQECQLLHRDISPYDGIDKECPLPVEGRPVPSEPGQPMSSVLAGESEEEPPGKPENIRQAEEMAWREQLQIENWAGMTEEQILRNEVCSTLFDGYEMNLFRQWFNAVQDINKSYLTAEDYQLARHLYTLLGMRVPDSITEGCEDGKET